jgi:hypothetical protein
LVGVRLRVAAARRGRRCPLWQFDAGAPARPDALPPLRLRWRRRHVCRHAPPPSATRWPWLARTLQTKGRNGPVTPLCGLTVDDPCGVVCRHSRGLGAWVTLGRAGRRPRGSSVASTTRWPSPPAPRRRRGTQPSIPRNASATARRWVSTATSVSEGRLRRGELPQPAIPLEQAPRRAASRGSARGCRRTP